jgi:hypothetical protein
MGEYIEREALLEVIDAAMQSGGNCGAKMEGE